VCRQPGLAVAVPVNLRINDLHLPAVFLTDERIEKLRVAGKKIRQETIFQ
jgi:hypothetical protein